MVFEVSGWLSFERCMKASLMSERVKDLCNWAGFE
jgi:hypothetical protein